MSLSVNLILPNEQRTASKVNLKTTIKIFAVALPMLLLVIIMQQGLRYYVLQTNLRIQESRWEAAEPRQRHAMRQQGRLTQNTQIKSEIAAWKESAPYWDSVLLAIVESTPANIQIVALRMQALAAPNQASGGSPPQRRPSLLIEGLVSEPNAMPDILSMKEAIENHPLTSQAISTADVINFAAAPSQDAAQMRVFSIRFQFKDLPRDNRSS